MAPNNADLNHYHLYEPILRFVGFAGDVIDVGVVHYLVRIVVEKNGQDACGADEILQKKVSFKHCTCLTGIYSVNIGLDKVRYSVTLGCPQQAG